MHNEFKKNSTFATKFVLLTLLCKITPYPPYHESKKNQITTSLFIN